MKKFGFVALVGRPNAGKSSILNALIGEELSIVTPLPQTTRQTIRGILNTSQGQIVFVDTPGMHAGKHTLNKAMAETVKDVLAKQAADAIVYVVDLTRETGEEESLIAGLVAPHKKCALILFNKSDLVPEYKRRIHDFFSAFPDLLGIPFEIVSAINFENKEEILSTLLSLLPQGEPHFPEEYATDANMRFLAAEAIRNQIIINTREEVPHASCVLLNDWSEEDGKVHIQADVVVETQGQKGILIGEGASRIKQIRQFSRKAIEKIVQAKVVLELFVKVRPNWRDNPGFLRQLGIAPPKKR